MQSINHGTWYARSAEVIHSPWMEWTVWLRMPGDIVFSVGAIAIALFTVRAIYAVFQQPTNFQSSTREEQEEPEPSKVSSA
jgi:nitric oxide reductase subunit B